MVPLLLIALSQCVKFHLIYPLIISEICFIQTCYCKIGKGNNSVITCDWVMVLELCISYHCSLSVYQGSFNYILYFQRYPSDKLFVAKIKKGNSSINTGDMFMVFAFYNSPHGPLSVSFINYLQYF